MAKWFVIGVRIGVLALVLCLLPGGVEAAGSAHKVIAAPGVVDETAPGVHMLADYGSYRLYRVTDAALGNLSKVARNEIRLADEMNVIQIDVHPIDTRVPLSGIPVALQAPATAGSALQLVQFVGPVKQQWLDALSAAGARPIQYIESNAYLVWADAAARQVLSGFASQGVFLQYSGAFHPYYKLGPTLRDPQTGINGPDRAVPVTIQIVAGMKTDSRDRIEKTVTSIDSTWDQVLSYRNVRVTVPLSRIAEIAALPDVTYVGERLPRTMNDEKQDQIVSGHLNPGRTGPSGTGYKAFIDAKGFPTTPASYPIVGLMDDGVGNGFVANGAGDPTFTQAADGTTTRLEFAQNCTTDADARSGGGHGHINTSIIGSYDLRTGDPFQDPDGYQRGLGINPYGRMGMTKIFTNSGGFSIGSCGGTDAGIIASNYNGGARISSNSWGCSGCASSYDDSSQAFDAGTRDALPLTAGNQELLFVFSAGNSGSGGATVGTPGNGKNMITVGASENDRPTWSDGCGVGPSGADNAMDVIDFSSRGPSPGGRRKPEVIAPGTHIQGTASTATGYSGGGVCDQFQPTTQTTYAASSGTSHSCPAVAGMASLTWRWLETHYLSATPSPALLKAYLAAHTTYLTGVGANDTLPSNSQGYGMPQLEMEFDDAQRYLVDQSVVFNNSGESWTFHAAVADPTKPVRIMMVYTDAPGAIGTSPQVNNLNLSAIVGGTTYLGNVFSGANSVAGGAVDNANNYEGIFLPAGTTGAIEATVTGFNIAGDGIPNTGDGTDQDFAFVCYNCATCIGSISGDKSSYNCNATVNITLSDSDLIGGGTQTVSVRSTTESTPESILLTESPAGSGVYVGTITTSAPPAINGDGSVAVVDGDTITLGYLDSSACGTPNVVIERTAQVDCQNPQITNVQVAGVTDSQATITWNTNEPANSQVTYGPSIPPGTAAPVAPAAVTSHSLTVTGLVPCTQYYASVASTDPSNNSDSDDNGGNYYTFTTGIQGPQQNRPYAGAPVPIPDSPAPGVNATITVADTDAIVDLDVTINSLTHTYVGDLEIHLIGPDNTDIILSNNRGGSGDNFVNTVFDDAAATSITTIGTGGSYTGSFQPEQALSAFAGKPANGIWKLFVVDQAGQDIGNINNWTLTFRFPAVCGVGHAVYSSHGLVSDACATGGAGGNGIWEAGETVNFKVGIFNDGTANLTNVTGTVTSSTPGVTMIDGTASYPTVFIGLTTDSSAPHFTAKLPIGAACGSTVSFQITINSDQGSWIGNFNQGVGQVVPGNATALNETFAGGIPAGWTVVDGGSGGANGANTWTTANPGSRSISPPLSAPIAIVDSDRALSGATQDEQLITPALNLSTATAAQVEFDHWFKYYTSSLVEVGDVDVKSTLTGGAWVNVYRTPTDNVPSVCSGTTCTTPDHRVVNITAQAAGAPDVQIRFHYYNASFEWWWEVDNVKVTYTAPGGCNNTVCPNPPAVVKPVPDGAFGTPMRVGKNDPLGSSLGVTWDVSTCVSTGYHILHGNLASVAAHTVSGSACAIGTSGAYTWNGVPASDLWFVVVADDNVSTEGNWGVSGPPSASGQCGMVTLDNSGSCP